MRSLTLILLLFQLAACCDSAKIPDTNSSVPPATTTLTELRRLHTGTTARIETNMVITGFVTSHDRASNFYQTLLIEEEGFAAELMAGIDGLHTIYPVGYRLTINLNGLAVGERNGILQIGRMPSAGSGYTTDYIGSRAALDRSVFRSNTHIALRPAVCTIGSLTPEMAGRLIRIDGLRFAPEEVEVGEWGGTKRFTDAENNAIYTYTRNYADFAKKEIPLSEVLLVGILQCTQAADGTIRYTLRLRDETDCWY